MRRKTVLYSSTATPEPQPAGAQPTPGAPAAAPAMTQSRWRRLTARLVRPTLLTALLLMAVALGYSWHPAQRQITQKDIDAAVLHTLENEPLPSAADKGYEGIRPSGVGVV